MGNILTTENTDFCNGSCEFTIDPFIFRVLILILISIPTIYYDIYRQKQNINRNKELLPRCENKIINSSQMIPIQQIEIQYNIPLYFIPKIRIALFTRSIDIYARSTVEINQSIDQIFPSIEERKLICYCDGSYSQSMQIGYAGFRASNGASQIRVSSPREPRYGSTDTEVLAAHIAIQYALENCYNTLIIYTDNSKVEQLIQCPKTKDNINYPDVCQILNQYKEQKGDDVIQVIRVRGHTSIYEQRKCKIKYEFAKIDRIVRKKTRRYRKRWQTDFKQNSYHGYYSYYNTWTVFEYYF